MVRGTMKRYLSMCLVVVMMLTSLLPVGAYAADDSAIEDTATNYEEPVASELEDVSVELEDQESEQVDDTSAVTEISDYATFLSCFKVLEGYAQTYAEENAGEKANALIINYIRTGVERYTSGTWEMVCGKENTAFTAYVSEQDTEKFQQFFHCCSFLTSQGYRRNRPATDRPVPRAERRSCTG